MFFQAIIKKSLQSRVNLVLTKDKLERTMDAVKWKAANPTLSLFVKNGCLLLHLARDFALVIIFSVTTGLGGSLQYLAYNHECQLNYVKIELKLNFWLPG